MTTLIIILPPEFGAAAAQFDYVLTPDGRSVTAHSRASLALLPALANGEIVAVVPVAALSWHQVQLPRGTLAKKFLSEGNSQRLRQVLEGLLEDHLLDDPAQLHFALAPGARDDAPTWVAVCDRVWLRTALQTLEQAGRPVARVVPEFAPNGANNGVNGGPADPGFDGNSLHVIGTPEDAQVVFFKNGVLTALPLSANAVLLADWPQDAPLLAEPAVAALAEGLFKRPAGLQQSAQRWLGSSQSMWDLAQFDLANSGRARSWRRVSGFFGNLMQSPRWRAARWSAAALVAANLLGLNAWAWSERASLAHKREAIREVLTTSFPGVKVVVDAPLQMARELTLLRQGAGGASSADFESVLASIWAVAPASQAYTAIEYAANEVRIKGVGVGNDQLAAVQEKLKRQGLAARLDGDVLVLRAEVNP